MELGWVVSLVAIAIAAWRLMCAQMRKRRLQWIAKLQDDPHTITACTLTLEFPFFYLLTQEIGVLRTFAIPSISRTLKKGNQYGLNPLKRFDDTEILATELMLHHIDSPRGSVAVRRLNYLHSLFNIDNADYLYVLCLGMVLPVQWASEYAYRPWSELEISSNYKVWHDIGVRMGIRDIPTSIEDAAKYVEDFEVNHMVYANSNHEMAEINIKLFLSIFPSILQPFVRKILIAFFDDRMREALGYPKQPTWLRFLSHKLLKMHGVVVSWMPPRPLASSKMRIQFGCPILNSSNDVLATTFPLAFQRFKPHTYEQGYNISHVGGVKLGKLGDAYEGALLCPLEKSKSCFPKA